jgi:hypothetical protein
MIKSLNMISTMPSVLQNECTACLQNHWLLYIVLISLLCILSLISNGAVKCYRITCFQTDIEQLKLLLKSKLQSFWDIYLKKENTFRIDNLITVFSLRMFCYIVFMQNGFKSRSWDHSTEFFSISLFLKNIKVNVSWMK